ncbi:uncharacterized protein LOC143199283 isoform X1 [Rhynchophorus ferrugineus]|uniref:uncharacterized protein LOC143199283 isoform X1 n=1 Tax=Rhynchophorus ferrugineus TaxID=354439 RepID=UPI003FCE27E0
MDNSNVENESKPYLKEFNFIITKTLKENHISANATDELESKDLNWQCQEVNRKINNVTKCTQEYIKKIEKLVIQIYQFNGSEAKILGSLEKTGKIITLISQELEKLKNTTSNSEKKNVCFDHKLNEIKNRLKQKQIIKKLKEEIEQLSQTSYCSHDSLLLEQHEKLKTQAKCIKDQLMANQSGKAKQLKINAEQIQKLEEIDKLQENNTLIKNNIYEKNKIQNAMQNEILNKETARLNQAIKRKDKLQAELNEQINKNNTWKQTIEIMKLNITEKQQKLLELSEKQTKKQLQIKEVEEKYLEELQHSRETLIKTNKDMDDIENQIIVNKEILTDKAHNYKDLQNEKEDLITAVCEKKVTYIKIQCAYSKEQFKIDALNEKLIEYTAYVKELKQKIEEIGKTLNNTKDDIGLNIKKFTEEKTNTISDYDEKARMLINQQSYQEASIELMQNRLQNSIGKIEKIKKDIKDCESDIKWDEIKLEVQKASLKTLRDKLQKQEELSKRLIEKKAENDLSTKLTLTVIIIIFKYKSYNGNFQENIEEIIESENNQAKKQLDKMSEYSWNKLVSESKKNTNLTKSISKKNKSI